MVLTFDPFREFDRLGAQVSGAGSGHRRLTTPMDVYRSGDHYVVHCDLPGIDPGSVDLSLDGSVLTIRAQRSSRTEHGVRWLRQERPTGVFERRLSVGDGLALDRIDATYQDGVLTVTLPLAEQAKPRRVPITVEGKGRVLEGTATEAPAAETTF